MNLACQSVHTELIHILLKVHILLDQYIRSVNNAYFINVNNSCIFIKLGFKIIRTGVEKHG